MLGALISVLMFGIFWFWIALIKNLRKSKKGEEKMSIFEFVLFCILTYLIVTPLLFMVCIMSDTIFFHDRMFNHDRNLAFCIIICFVLVSIYVFLQIKKYKSLLDNHGTKNGGNVDNEGLEDTFSKEQTSSNNGFPEVLKKGNGEHSIPTKVEKEIFIGGKTEERMPSAFIKTYTLIEFARQYGPKMQVGTFTNSKTHENYKACLFTDNNGLQTYVSFSSELGELNPSQIEERKSELMIGQLSSRKYILYDNNWHDWADVELGI